MCEGSTKEALDFRFIVACLRLEGTLRMDTEYTSYIWN